MLTEVRYQVIEKLLQRLIDADFPPDLACDMVSLIEVEIDLAQPEVSDIDQVAEQHANDLIEIRDRLYAMLRRTMNTSKRPALHRVPSLLDIMLRNIARRYRISLSA